MTGKKRSPVKITVPLRVPFPEHCMALGREQTWEIGDHIPRPKRGGGIYLLASGEARLLHYYQVGNRRMTRLLFMARGPGMLYEAVGVLGTPANTSAKATRPCVTVFLDKKQLAELLNNDHHFTAFLLQEVTQKAGQITRHMLWTTFDEASGALLDYLYERAAMDGKRVGGTVRLKIGREVLAEDMGTHPRTIIRWLQKLEDQGSIEVWHGGVTLLKSEQAKTTVATDNLVPRSDH